MRLQIVLKQVVTIYIVFFFTKLAMQWDWQTFTAAATQQKLCTDIQV